MSPAEIQVKSAKCRIEGRFHEAARVYFRNEFSDFLLQRVADAFDFAQTIFRNDLGERLVQGFNRAGGVGVGAGLERIFALQFQQRADAHENFRDLIFVHAGNMEREV